MSTRAYRLSSSEDQYSFNLWRDITLTDFLAEKLDIDFNVLKHSTEYLVIPVEILEQAMSLSLSDKIKQAIQNDIAWAKTHYHQAIAYYCA